MATLKAGPGAPARTVFKFHGCRYSAAAVGVQLEVCLCVAALGWAAVGSIKLGLELEHYVMAGPPASLAVGPPLGTLKS